MNTATIAAALRLLADAFEAPAEGSPPAAAPPTPQPRGRGRPPKPPETTAPAPAPAAADPFEQPSKTTQDEVRAALTALRAATDQRTALGVLQSVGLVDTITALDPAKYTAVAVAAHDALPKSAAPAAPVVVEEDPFETPAAPEAAPAKPLTIEDVKAAIVAAQKRTSQDAVQKLVMQHGGRAAKPEGGEGPSLKALPPEQFAVTIAALQAMSTTK